MTVRPPQALRGPPSPEINPLEIELLHERAVTLGRLAEGLRSALDALAAFDAAHPDRAGSAPEQRLLRDDLVATAAEALWYLMIQRDACGLHRNEDLVRDYGVPREVMNRAGPRPRQP